LSADHAPPDAEGCSWPPLVCVSEEADPSASILLIEIVQMSRPPQVRRGQCGISKPSRIFVEKSGSASDARASARMRYTEATPIPKSAAIASRVWPAAAIRSTSLGPGVNRRYVLGEDFQVALLSGQACRLLDRAVWAAALARSR
jgi:hypothetical protein